MNLRMLGKRLVPPILLDGLRSAREAGRARRARRSAAAGAWRTVQGGMLDGCELRLPYGESWADKMLNGDYEAPFAAALADAVTPGAICYDLGGHLGYYSLIMARKAGAGGAVHVFEPYPANALRLSEHVARNATRTGALIHVHQIAIEAQSGVRELLGEGRADAVSTLCHLDGVRGVLVPEWQARFERFERIPVAVSTLDGWRAQTGASPPDLVKIDVEGSELGVLLGARETLASARPVIVAELHNAGLAAECGALLGAMGYAVETILCDSGRECTIRAMPSSRRGG